MAEATVYQFKTCFKCAVTKPLSEFYRHSKMGDGFLNKCKECTKNDVKTHRLENIEKVREYDRSRGNLPHRVAARAEYMNTHHGQSISKSSRDKWAEINAEKRSAYYVVNNAVRDGRLQKLPCSVCGNPDSEGHHQDYSKPLDVIWMCPKHHAEHHKIERENMRQISRLGASA